MRNKYSKRFHKLLALACVTSMLTVDCFAVVKEVNVWGAKSINDAGGSDLRITMDELQEDNSGFLQTSGMTEYFHKDQPVNPKVNMSEAISWLIDNEIINRDEIVRVTNVNSMPQVSIEHANINEKLFYNVNRSDALMYLYKGVFGPLYGRTIAVETPNIRTDKGIPSRLSDMIAKYSEWLPNTVYGQSIATQGTPGGAGGGKGGDASNTVEYTNDANAWRYTPQGDEYTSVFGDTNIFISENHFTQDSTGGDGGKGGSGGSGGSGGYYGDGGSGGDGGNGGGGGASQNIINYETDYKSIYFIPGSDLMFYRNTDVVEMYLQALLNKGILEDDSSLRTEKYLEEFLPLTNSGSPIAHWSGNADPYVVNLSRGTKVRLENVQSSRTQDVLGENYNVQFSNNTLSINRLDLFESSTGYFETESVTRMDLYRYIYKMVSANEKKLSDLERDIVNYKYGMEFAGVASEEDIDAIKYLVAMGILDFNGSNELSNLYGPVSWDQFLPILYRVANKNARLDFSKVQLTDSEKSWKAAGFAQQTVHIATSGDIGTVSITLPESGSDAGQPDYPVLLAQDNTAFGLSKLFQPTIVRALSKPTSFTVNESGLSFSVNLLARETVNSSDPVLSYTAKAGGIKIGSYFLDAKGMEYAVGSTEDVVEALRGYLQQAESLSAEELDCIDEVHSAYDSSNPLHSLRREMLLNVYALRKVANNDQLTDVVLEWAKADSATWKDNIRYRDARERVASVLCKDIADASNFSITPSILSYGVVNTGNNNTVISKQSISADDLPRTEYCDFTVPTSITGVKQSKTYRIYFSKDFSNTISGDMYEVINNSNATVSTTVDSQTLKMDGLSETVRNFTKTLGSSNISGMFNEEGVTASLKQQVNTSGKDAFVSWGELFGAVNGEHTRALPIEQISETLLYNTETGIYAYFSQSEDKSESMALVGADVVIGDSTYGVVFKDGTETYYHMDAIRLLVNASQSAVIGDTRAISLDDAAVIDAITKVPVVSESGVENNSISGLTVQVSDNYSEDFQKFSADSVFRTGKTGPDNTWWCDYIALSQSSGVLNSLTRRIQYTPADGVQGTDFATAYVVVNFKPVDVGGLGTATVSEETSLQDLLDMPVAPPADSIAKELWTKNKELCNLYANWLYGTGGVNYIETGYLVPQATVYLLPDITGVFHDLPLSYFGSLTKEQIESIPRVGMGAVEGGYVVGIGDALVRDGTTKADYYIASDASAFVHGERIYLHRALYDKLTLAYGSAAKPVFKTVGMYASTAAFTLGSSFVIPGADYIAGSNGENELTLNARVVKTNSSGTVTAQVGPIYGAPVVTTSGTYIVSGVGDGYAGPRTVSELAALGVLGDQIAAVKSDYIECLGLKYKGIADAPHLITRNGRTGVFDGEHITLYSASTGEVIQNPIKVHTASDTMESAYNSLKREYSASGVSYDPWSCETYLLVEFPAFSYTVEDGVLKHANSSAAEFLPLSLFTSLNDLIINDMLNKSRGAIPVNDIEVGALLEIGSGFYQAVGDADKSFVGYAHLDSYCDTPKLADIGTAFGSTFVRAANQYINVSHFFNSVSILTDPSQAGKDALKNVASSKMSADDTSRYAVFGNGDMAHISGPQVTASAGQLYAPVELKFMDGLMAYKCSTAFDSVVVYKLCTTAATVSNGAFAEVPFFSDSVLESNLLNEQTSISALGFKYFAGAGSLREKLALEFEGQFAHDLLTLTRMLLFLVLMWLVVASWICYMVRVANLVPILEDIRQPTSNQQRKGVDLLKIISLGTISLDTEFGLGRFLQYNAILAALICVVMMTGDIAL